jgi:nicotinate-nucleotide adenylyltransferase
LKNLSNLEPLPQRLEACEAITTDPQMKIAAFELNLPSRYTIDTLAYIMARNPGVKFVWIMGADNFGQFHLWERWRSITELMPIAVVDRPGSTLVLHSARAAHALRRYRIDEDDAAMLANTKPPAWTFLHGPRSSLSSTEIRTQKK